MNTRPRVFCPSGVPGALAILRGFCERIFTVQRESPGVAPVVHTGGIITPPEVTKFTAVPSGTGLPWRSASDKVTFDSSPSTLAPSIENFSTDKLTRAWAERPDAMVKTAESVCTAGLDTSAALTKTLVGTVPEKTGTDTKP